jgi:H/ACA ribonucleoprotein complex non-core subunit NAF1
MLTVQEIEFSDDEAEIEHKRSLKRKRGHRGLPEGRAGHRSNGRGENMSEANDSSRVDVSRNSNYRPLSRPVDLELRAEPHSVWGSTNTSEERTFGGHNRSQRDSDRGSIYGQQRAVQQAEPWISNTSPYPSQSVFSHPYQRQQYPSYDVPPFPHPTFSPSHLDGSFPPPASAPQLPPGAYVNPAFFNPPSEGGVQQQPHLATVIQQQMDILSNTWRRPPQQ